MTTASLPKQFRVLYILGIILCFISLFLEWYIYQVYDSSNRLQSYWTYNPLTGWTTIFSKSSSVNNSLRPETIEIPITLTFLYIFMLALSAFSVIFRDVEKYPRLEQLIVHAYGNIFLLLLMLFYIFAFPVFYLIPNNLYFPFLHVKDNDANLIYQYSIGPGYCAHLLGFILVAPYALFYYTTVMKFQSQKDTAQSMVNQFIKTIQEPLDLDKLIAKEQLKLKLGDVPLNTTEELKMNSVPQIKRRVEP